MSPMIVKALVALVAVASVAELAAGKNYTIQWTASGDYGDWSAKNPVRVGDTVVFTYESSHTVDELSKPDYETCSFTSPMSSDQSGSTAFTFDKAGTRYFACAADSASHCNRGQKVAITVADGAAGAQSPPPPKENPAPPAKGNSPAPKGNSAPPMVGLSVKVVLGLGIGGAFLAAF